MNLLYFRIRNIRFSSFFTIELLFLLISSMFSIVIYPFDQNLSSLLFILIILTYSLLNLISGFLSLKQNDEYVISIFSIILGISYVTYVSYLLLSSSIENIPLSLKTGIDLFIYFRPYLTALTILLICRFSTETANFKNFLISTVIVFITLLVLIFIANSTSFIQASMISLLYLASLFYLWKQQLLIERLDLISTIIVFILIIISEVVIIFSNDYNLGILFNLILYITLIFPLYLLYTMQAQYFLFSMKPPLPSQQHLYKLNSDLMNKFFTFKETELQNLRAEADAKDGLYKQLFDFAPDAFLIFINNKITYVNKATLTLLNATHEREILNTPIWHFIHPNSISLVRSLHKAIINPETDTIVDELQLLSLDKQIKEVRISSTYLHLNRKNYIILCLHDLSNDKTHKRIQSQLEENVANEKFKVEFFANISHDLKTPVNVIYSAAQLQDLCATDCEYDKVKMYNNVIKQNCLRLQKLLNDLLDITKLDANHFNSFPRPCNIIQVAEDIVESVASYVAQKNITILFDTNVEEKFVLTDPDLIERILLNLISNAIKYGKQNGHIWVTLYDEGNHLIMSIKDDGMGIPISEVPHIFKRFHKVPGCADNNSRGSGIGLSLVKSITKVLGGTISCLSKEGSGSEFILILPMISCNDEYNGTTPDYTPCPGSENNLNIELSDT